MLKYLIHPAIAHFCYFYFCFSCHVCLSSIYPNHCSWIATASFFVALLVPVYAGLSIHFSSFHGQETISYTHSVCSYNEWYFSHRMFYFPAINSFCLWLKWQLSLSRLLFFFQFLEVPWWHLWVSSAPLLVFPISWYPFQKVYSVMSIYQAIPLLSRVHQFLRMTYVAQSTLSTCSIAAFFLFQEVNYLSQIWEFSSLHRRQALFYFFSYFRRELLFLISFQLFIS